MFPSDALKFLMDLEANNNREWFTANKKRFEQNVQAPALEFVRAMAPRLKKISPALTADDRKVGGSLMRIYRDVRFSKDKTPYNTHIAFRFVAGDGLGCYLSIEVGTVTLGSGIWQPDKEPLLKIRKAIAKDPALDRRFVGAARFAARRDTHRSPARDGGAGRGGGRNDRSTPVRDVCAAPSGTDPR